MNSQLISLWLGILVTSIEIAQGILNGNIADGDEFRYQVYLRSDDDLLQPCGGAVIDEWHILTAAHCVYNIPVDEITVYAGTYQLEVDDVIIRDVIKVYLPKGFVPGLEDTDDKPSGRELLYRDENDIALLKLLEPLTLGTRVRAIPLPAGNRSCPGICKIAGWGATTINSLAESTDLLWYEAIIGEPSFCRKQGAAHRDNEFCAIDIFKKSTPLKGDSGGGLVCGGVLMGILSTGTIRADIPAIYVDVYSFLPFINDKIMKNYQREEEPISKKRRMKRDFN